MSRVLNTDEKNRNTMSFVKCILLILLCIGYTVNIGDFHITKLCILGIAFVVGFGYIEDEKSNRKIYNGFMQYALPYILFFVSYLAVAYIIGRCGKMACVLDIQYIGMKDLIKNYVLYTKPYIDIFGPIWILFSLFLCIVLHNIVNLFNYNNKIYVYVVLGTMNFLIGNYICNINNPLWQYSGILLMVYALFEMGYVLNHINFAEYVTLLKNKIIIVCSSILVICAFVYVIPKYITNIFGENLNEFNFMVLIISAFLILYVLGDVITSRVKVLNGALNVISKNSLGVVILLFPVIKGIGSIMYKIGVISLDDVKGIMSPNYCGTKYWWLITLLSLILCVAIWIICMKLKPFRIIFGQDDEVNNIVYSKIKSLKILQRISDCYIRNTNKVKEYIKYIFSDYRRVVLCISMIVFTLVLAIPILRCGLSCNDELQTRYWGMQSISEFYKRYIGVLIREGRILAVLSVPSEYFIEFAFRSRIWKGIISLLIIGLDLTFIITIINKLFNNKTLNYVFFIIFTVCLPITFEHTLPNTYVAFLGIPTMLFFASVVLAIRFFETSKKKFIVSSAVLLFISLCSYESIITLMPLYVIVVWFYSKNEKNILVGMIKKILVPFSTSVVYLFTYLIMGKIVETQYDGTVMTFESINQSFAIVKNLMFSATPGYYTFFSPKYKYLYNLYSHDSSTTIIGKTLSSLLDTRIVLLFIVLAIIMFILSNKPYKKVGYVKTIIVVIVTALLMMFPALPYSISKQYQNNVGEISNIALPGTYLMYIYAVFAISYIMYQLVTNKSVVIKTTSILLMLLYFISIQNMNSVFTTCHSNNNDRMENIEQLLGTNFITNFNGKHIMADDIYETQNLLAFHNGYWTSYCNLYGLDITLDKDESDETKANIDMLSNDIFEVTYENLCWIISTKPINGNIYIETDEDIYSVCSYSYQVDNGMYIYTYKLNRGDFEEYGYYDATEDIK